MLTSFASSAFSLRQERRSAASSSTVSATISRASASTREPSGASYHSHVLQLGLTLTPRPPRRLPDSFGYSSQLPQLCRFALSSLPLTDRRY